MSLNQAQSILHDLVSLEFPKLMGFSIVFALFKTYGVPSVSKLLVSTGQLANEETTSKRTADTGVLLLEFCLNPPGSERARKAIARMNYLHSRYQRNGLITNEDMLYTLSLFALEPTRWIANFEWRQLTDLEKCASGTFWKGMGDAMNITYELLPSGKSNGAGWEDGLDWLNEIEAWSVEYEKEKMVPHPANKKLAAGHLDLLFLNVPARFKMQAKMVVATLVGDRLATAMMLPTPTSGIQSLIRSVFGIRKFVLRHLTLPRPEFRRKSYIPEAADPMTGRYISKEYLSHPWYVKPTLIGRWGLKAWLTWCIGRKLPGDDGNKYAPEGYAFEDVGPSNVRGKGLEEMSRTEERLYKEERGSWCPFHVAIKG